MQRLLLQPGDMATISHAYRVLLLLLLLFVSRELLKTKFKMRFVFGINFLFLLNRNPNAHIKEEVATPKNSARSVMQFLEELVVR